ncbi:MAG: Ribosomal RNA large subunit methyltransferase K/L [Chlamydiales bacterium]|nr:Ribosomal RNA large subunit methyltransferase K/L [Chlamydiales bacterium]MCH9635618.1 Ribosomal RNA large subunit methyltransferase K/L [Chlamydiales bacterium]
MSYALLESGDGRKLERFGDVVLDRPAPTALWRKRGKWKCDAAFVGKRWKLFKDIPASWQVEIEGIRFKLKRTDFGHLGIFPEQAAQWRWLQEHGRGRIMNLFAYSGGSTLACPGEVTHLDAARGMVDWARENALLNKRENIRWIVDDVRKFVKRELKRGAKYDGIILDPPTFGRGKSMEVFKIEKDLVPLLDAFLEFKPSFVLLSCHTPGYTPTVLSNLLRERFGKNITAGEMVLPGKEYDLPSGAFARWSR